MPHRPQLKRRSPILLICAVIVCIVVSCIAQIFLNQGLGTHAVGEVSFINDSDHTIMLSSMILVGHDGTRIIVHGPITVPITYPGFIVVPAYAVHPGASGNIEASDLNRPCCTSGIFVKNAPFHGGCDGLSLFHANCDGIRVWSWPFGNLSRLPVDVRKCQTSATCV